MTSARGAVYGPPSWSTATANLDLGAQAANAATENAILAGPLEPGASPLAYPVGATTVGLFFSHCRRDAATGALLGAWANVTGAPIDPAAEGWIQGRARPGVHRENIPRSGFQVIQQDRLNLDLGAIAAGDTGFVAAAAQLGQTQPGDIVICSPTQVLAAGVAFSVAFVQVGPPVSPVVRAFNLTAAPVNPAAQNFDFTVLRGATGAGAIPGNARQGSSGRIVGETFRVTIDHGAIGADAVLEATAAIAPAHEPVIPGPGATAIAFPTAALPVGVGISHARISANNTIAIALADLTGAGINPAAVTYDVLVFRQCRDPLG